MWFTVKKKVTKVKRNFRKQRGHKQKVKEADCALKLLAELPFTNTEVWKELGCKSHHLFCSVIWHVTLF